MKNNLTRKELYDLVWSTPVTKLLAEFDISNNTFKKLCEKYKIPLPEAGFWMKKEYGKPVNIIPFIESNDINDLIVLENIYSSNKVEENQLKPNIHLIKKQIEKEMAPYLIVPKTVTKWHPLIEDFNRKYAQAKDESKRIGYNIPTNDCLNIYVKDIHLKRALLIFDTLIKLLEARNHKVFQRYNRTVVSVFDNTYELSIRSKNKRIVETNTNYSYNSTVLVPVDIIIFKILKIYSYEYMDTSSSLLEDKLSLILARLEFVSKESNIRREYHRQNQLLREAEEAKKQELKRIKELEISKFKSLVADANRWKKSQILYEYISVLKSNSTNLALDAEYLQWAMDKADWLNPTINKIDSMLEGIDPNSI